MSEKFEREERKFKKGSYSFRLTNIYLTPLKSSLRIEIRRLTMRTTTAEIELVRGDDVLILKHSYKKVVLKNPTKMKLDGIVDELIQFAKDNKLI